MLQRSTMSLQRVPELQLAGKGLRPLMNRGSYPTPVNIISNLIIIEYNFIQKYIHYSNKRNAQ